MPVKKEVTNDKKQETNKKNVIANVVKQSSPDKTQNKIATSPKAPRNDRKKGGLSVALYSLAGKTAGTLDLPKEVFGAEVNQDLLKQALRVYSTNIKSHRAHTKTRGEVRGSTRKIWKQKGTGRARHGAITAPIFVGGGIALGPRVRNVILDLPEKMKKKALISALSQKALDSGVIGVSGLDKASGKTKEMATLIKKVEAKSALIVTGDKSENAKRATGNLKNTQLISAQSLNAYEGLRHQSLLLTKEAVEKLKERLVR